MSSGCGDVLSLADLQTAKKHQIFEAEVITGKSGGVATGADIDYATNQVTGQTQKTLPAVLRDAGFSPVSWDFSTGGTLTVNDRDKVVYDPASKTWYSYAGTLPVVVPASFNPVGSADWKPQTDPNLRDELAANTGAGLIGTTLGGNVDEKLSDVISAQYRDRNINLLAEFQYKCRTKQNVKIVCQGDSITAGMDTTSTDVTPPDTGDAEVNPTITHATITYPARLGVYLNYASGIPVSIEKRGVSGHTAKEGYEYWTTDPSADVVFLMYGINDSDPANSNIDEYMDYMGRLIRRYIDWGCGVVVMTCASGGMGRTDPLYQKYAQRAKNMAKVYGCSYFNANEALYYIPRGVTEADGVHLNSIGYAKLGEAIASYIMAGGIVDSYEPINGETFFWPGAQTDSVGFYDACGNFETYYNDGSYIVPSVVGRMVAGQPSRVSFAFYQPMDAAEIEVIGHWDDMDVVADLTSEPVSLSVFPPYYNNYHPRSPRYTDWLTGQSKQVILRNRSGGKLSAVPRVIGSMVGRGWKTITFKTREGTGSVNDVFIQGITVRPVNKSAAMMDFSGAAVVKGTDECYRQFIPHRANNQDGLSPTPVRLNAAIFPLPRSLYGVSFNNDDQFWDCGIAEVTLRCIGGNVGTGLVKWTIFKDTGGINLSAVETFRAGTNMPTIALAAIRTKTKEIINAKGSFAPNMPIENIYGVPDTFNSSIDMSPAGRLLTLNFDYSTANDTGFWYIEVRSVAPGSGEFCASAC